jgi:hypothetical protein
MGIRNTLSIKEAPEIFPVPVGGNESVRVLLIILHGSLNIFFLVSLAVAQHQHGGHQTPGMPGTEGEKRMESTIGSETSSNRAFLLEGVKASFSILPMAEHQKMLKDMKMKLEMDPQATHNIAVTLTDTRNNLPLKDAVVKMKVIGPKGKEEIKVLDPIPAMNQYARNFTLDAKGRYQILVLFQVAGKKRAMGFYYLLK